MNILEKYQQNKKEIEHCVNTINSLKTYKDQLSDYRSNYYGSNLYRDDYLKHIIDNKKDWNEIIDLIIQYYKNKLNPLIEENKKIELQIKSINETQDFMIELDTPINLQNNKNDKYRDEAVESLEDLLKTVYSLFKKLYKVFKSL